MEIGTAEMIERTKFVAEGATSLAEVAARMRAFADELERLAGRGWELSAPVDDGYLHMELRGTRL